MEKGCLSAPKIGFSKKCSSKKLRRTKTYLYNENLHALKTLVPFRIDEADQHISFMDALMANKFEYRVDTLQFPHFEKSAQTYTYSAAEISPLLLNLIEKAKIIHGKPIVPSWTIKMRGIEQLAPDKKAKAMKKIIKKLTREDKYVTQLVRLLGFLESEDVSKEEKTNRIALKNALFKGNFEALPFIYKEFLQLFPSLQHCISSGKLHW
jgi:hypothetical protein